jgi:8-oxo-dGTP pyrophosphatase MutT (NUDIX family)
MIRERPSSRLLVIDARKRVLLFRFEHKQGALAGQTFWATPGGGLDPGESFAGAARRELLEETGLAVVDPGPEVHQRTVTFQMPEGDMVRSDERFFLIRVENASISNERWTDLEQEVIAAHHWWSAAELLIATEQIWPEDLHDVLVSMGVWQAISLR